MTDIFLKIINMSILASWIILAVLILRIFLKKAPKWISCLLWSIAGIRLIMPFSLESVLSLIPSAETVSPDIMTDPAPSFTTGIATLNSAINPVITDSFAPAPGASANPLQILIPILAAIWIAGMLALLIYAAVSFLRLKHKVATSILLRNNIYQSEHIAAPFVLGIVRPKIYLPFNIKENDAEHVIAHEQAHLKRRDHLWKPIGFLLLSLHWFNPLVWLGYILLCRDIELACDEKVIKELGRDARADYSATLLSCSVKRSTISACPLAFGEVGIKARVKSVLNYKKPALWITIAAILLTLVLAVCFLTDPKDKIRGTTDPAQLNEYQETLLDQYPQYFGLDASDGLDVYVYQMAENSYSFALFPHTELTREMFSSEMLNIQGIGTTEMKAILATYDVPEENIYIIPWQNPISSYIGDYWIIESGETEDELKQRREAYVNNIRELLFGTESYIVGTPYDEMIFDVDGDGKNEVCVLSHGFTSGLYTFIFSAHEVGEDEMKYYEVVYSNWFSPRFVKGNDGVVRVEGREQGDDPETRLFDIVIISNLVVFNDADGNPIGDSSSIFELPMLIYDAPSYSWVLSSQEVPKIVISDGTVYADGERYGTVSKTKLTKQNFDNLIGMYPGFDYSEKASELRKNNATAYLITPDAEEGGVGLYYYLIQNDGSELLVYGHYKAGERDGVIRWIFQIKLADNR